MVFKSIYPNIPIPETNIVHRLFPPGKPVSDRPHWIDAKDEDHYLTPVQGLLWAKRLGMGLDRLGVPEGARVLLVSPNHIFVPVVYLGVVGSKRAFSGSNPAFTAAEISHQIKTTEPHVVLSHPSVLKTVQQAIQLSNVQNTRLFQFSDQPIHEKEGIPDWRTFLLSEDEAQKYEFPTISGQEARATIATINFSSGTTGLPKGTCVTHYNVVANLEQCMFSITRDNDTIQDARWIGFLPLYHAYGQLYSCMMSMLLDTPVYVMSKFDFEDYLRVIQKYRITTLQLVPPVLRMLTDRPEPDAYDLSSIRDVLCGAAPLSQDLRKRFNQRFGVPIREGWGMTEVVCGGISTPISLVRKGTDSVGYLYPNSECKLIKDDGTEAGEGEPGELYLKGPQVFLKYWRNEKASQDDKTSDGFLKTGDIAMIKNNEFWIVDRKKELIKVKGLQVSPAELEATLGENPHIEDVAVVGIATAQGEAPRAYVTLKPSSKGKITEKDIQKWLEGRASRHKWLTGGVVFVNAVPRLASGKIQRKTVKAWAKEDGIGARSKL